jgi:hypothetical protein
MNSNANAVYVTTTKNLSVNPDIKGIHLHDSKVDK